MVRSRVRPWCFEKAAVDAEHLDSNPARGIRVSTERPRLNSRRQKPQRRAVPGDDVAALMNAVRTNTTRSAGPHLTGPGQVSWRVAQCLVRMLEARRR
jgi:hypothetical protein